MTAVILPAVPDPQNGGKLTRARIYDYTYDVYGDIFDRARSAWPCYDLCL